MNTNNLQAELSANQLKSNTSIVGIVCKDGIVMAADRRVTAGNLIVNKEFKKAVPINDYLIACWTGGLADAAMSFKVVAAELRLKELKTKTRPTVEEAANLIGLSFYKNIRTPSTIPAIVGFLVGGVDENGKTSLYTIEPAGSVVEVKDYDANFSSGMPFILGLLERQYRKDLSVKEGVELAKECLKSSTQRDSGSGNGIDVFTITPGKIEHVVSEEIIPQYK